MTNTVSTALLEGVQRPFEVRMYSLGDLLNMRTATTNEQTPLDPKRNDALAQDLARNMQVEPFKVLDLEGELYLGAGRNRAYCQAQVLNRPLSMEFACLYYKVETVAQINSIIVQDNISRKVPKQEKVILSAAGATGKEIGRDDLTDDYQFLLDNTQLKELKTLFAAENLAKLIELLADVDLSGTTIIQIMTSTYKELFTSKKYKGRMAFFYGSPANIYALQAMLLKVIPPALRECMKAHPRVSSWSRDGKQYLVDAANKAVGENLIKEFKFPDLPESVKATESKAKKPAAPKAGVMQIAKAPVASTVTTPAVNSVPPVESVVEEETESIPL